MKKIAVTGARGYIGKALVKAGCLPLYCDVTDYEAVEAEVCNVSPDLVLHLGGKSKPEWVEKNHKEAARIHVHGTHYVMLACVAQKIPVVTLSSSQIWGGGWWEHLWNRHAENSRLTPAVNSYGMQKFSSEAITFVANDIGGEAKVIRTSFVFNGERFSKQLADLEAGMPIDAPRFLKRSFIHLEDFVTQVLHYCQEFKEMPPVLHLAGSKTVSYFDLWLEVAKQFGYDRKLIVGRWRPLDDNFSACRPRYGGLDVGLSRTLGFKQASYVDGIKRMKDETTSRTDR
jgi:dTDP-4-dehydrorhamnose reductase